MHNSIIPVLLLLSSFVPAVIIFFLNQKQEFLRNFLNLTGVFFKIVFVIYLFIATSLGETFVYSFRFIGNIDFVLHTDKLSLLFISLSTFLWFLTTLYAIAYLKGSQNKSRFFGFFSLCITATVGLALAGNLFTFFVFYELLTLATFPLVMHERTHEAKLAAISYLKYTIAGGVLLLLGIAGIYAVTGSHEFVSGGYLEGYVKTNETYFYILFLFLLLGVGVKSALFPLHGWLPKAMAAPAPVSALLHAVAVVKAGAFGIVRIVYDVYGIETADMLGLLTVLGVFAVTTVVYGSVKALMQTEIKKRLAYSTVSQVSYIALGVSIFGALGSIGGIVHLVHQGMMKITLFFCAGAFSKTYGIVKVEQLNGLASKMPFSSFAFSVGALGMIGLPPLAGFISKWYLALGAVENGMYLAFFAIGVSALLNASYFLPLIYRIYFLTPCTTIRKIEPTRFETRLFLLLPPLITAFVTIALGVFALSDYGVVRYVETIVSMEYGK
jgi:multicomponent Na+:H+ antiporter subunit D